MPSFALKDCLSEVVGLKNDTVFKVFTCPDCKTDVTISRYQAEGQLFIICARCNSRYQVRGDKMEDESTPRNHFFERFEGGKPVVQPLGYKVFMKTDATQKATPIPKDSFVLVMKPQLAAPKPVIAPRPAGAPGAAPAPSSASGQVAPGAVPRPAAPAAAAATAAPKPATSPVKEAAEDAQGGDKPAA
jgi:hypothetical protein